MSGIIYALWVQVPPPLFVGMILTDKRRSWYDCYVGSNPAPGFTTIRAGTISPVDNPSDKRVAVGSNPTRRIIPLSPRSSTELEQKVSTLPVAGSNPAGGSWY